MVVTVGQGCIFVLFKHLYMRGEVICHQLSPNGAGDAGSQWL